MTVLALYGVILAVGTVATLVHKSFIATAGPAALQLNAEAPIR